VSTRQLGKLLGTFHNISYYAPEMKAFADLGLPEYWRAYMAYRSAPMGRVSPAVVQATFYNFAPNVVAAAIPSAWHTTTPAEVLGLRDQCVETALGRALGSDATTPMVEEAADLALHGIDGCDAGARPLFGAHAELTVPEQPAMRLWHAATLWREFRGDGHNLALAHAALDGIDCHVLLAGRGVGNKSIICKIRGWSSDAWDASMQRLVERDLLTADGRHSTAGRDLRRAVEDDTDRLAQATVDNLGPERSERLIKLMEPLVARLVETGAVAGSWPPPKPPK